MGVYATPTDLDAWVAARNPELQLPADREALIRDAELMVDRALGPYVKRAGLKLNPPSRLAERREALKRATCAAAEFIAMQDAEERTGSTDFLPTEVSTLRVAGRVSPRMLEELAGST
jgi:hypothetical protein